MSASWVDHVVSVDCGELGTYQGQVTSVDNTQQTITLSKAFRNGVPYQLPEVTIDAVNICDLTILKTPQEVSASMNSNQNARTQATATKSTPMYRKSPDIRKVREQSHRGGSPSGRTDSPSRAEFARKRTNSASELRDSPRRQQSTPRKIESHQRQRQQREDCFSTPVESFIGDFDFEKNLALFDKEAGLDESNRNGPRVVKGGEPQYRCDQNVLQSRPPVFKQIKLPAGCRGANTYVTDADLEVPSVNVVLRERLLSHAESLGYTRERQLETIGRSTSEMVLTLLGGVHRLNPKSSHQRPTVVLLCGPHRQGMQGINCARHLANRQVNTLVCMPQLVHMDTHLSSELDLYGHTGGKRLTSIQELPSNPVDMIVSCLDNSDDTSLTQTEWYKSIVTWSNDNRAPVLTIDPPEHPLTINTKWSLAPGLPLSYHETSGALYLCDMGFGKKVFSDLNITYKSPFGHKFVIPLHVKQDSK